MKDQTANFTHGYGKEPARLPRSGSFVVCGGKLAQGLDRWDEVIGTADRRHVPGELRRGCRARLRPGAAGRN